MITPEVKIATYEDFLSETRYKKEQSIVFRGQTQDYGKLIPALYRPGMYIPISSFEHVIKDLYLKAYDAQAEARDVYQKAWAERERQEAEAEEYAKRWAGLHGGDEDEAINFYLTMSGPFGLGDPMMADDYVGLTWSDPATLSLALLQHYGIPTGALDVTFNANIALWFATHSYVPKTDTCSAHYVPSMSSGVVYILDATRVEVIDLRTDRHIPKFGLRGVRQQGGLLLGATAEASDLSHHVAKKLVIEYSIYETALIQYPNLTQDYLFPSRKNDEFYDTLLKEKASASQQVLEIAKYIVEFNSRRLPWWIQLDGGLPPTNGMTEFDNMVRTNTTLSRPRRLLRKVTQYLRGFLR